MAAVARYLMITRSKPVAVVGSGRRIPKVKCNESLRIKRNGKSGFSGLSARFTPSRENSYDKVQRDNQPSRTEGWFEILVGKRLATEGQPAKCFGFVRRYDPQPEGRLSEWLNAQGDLKLNVFGCPGRP